VSASATITPRGPFSLAEAAMFGFGQRDAAAWDGVLRLAFCLDGYQQQVGVEVRQDAAAVVHAAVHGPAGVDVAAVRRQVARVLSLDHDGAAFMLVGERDPVIGTLQAAAPGLPVLQRADRHPRHRLHRRAPGQRTQGTGTRGTALPAARATGPGRVLGARRGLEAVPDLVRGPHPGCRSARPGRGARPPGSGRQLTRPVVAFRPGPRRAARRSAVPPGRPRRDVLVDAGPRPRRQARADRAQRRTATGCRWATPTSRNPAQDGTVEAWGRSAANPVGGWYGMKKGLRGRFGNYVPPVLEALGLAEVEHNPRNNRMRAR